MNPIEKLCKDEAGNAAVLQGNIAFAVGCVRAGIHAVDGYPGTPSSEVIDKGLSQVQDLITVGWSVSEAVAAGVGHGHSLAGRDCVVTMKIPGLYQAGDIFTSVATYTADRGGLIFYVASDYTPSSTQHVIDSRYLYKSCFVPVFEPRSHQEMHESALIAVEIARKFNTPIVIQPSGVLCHSEGLVRMMETTSREPAQVSPLREQNSLPVYARANYNKVMAERMPGLLRMVEESPLNVHIKGAGKRGVITHGVNSMYMDEYKALFDKDIDILSLGFTNPLPMEKIRQFCESIEGDVYVIEDGYRFIQESCTAAGLTVIGKPEYSDVTEWTPASIAVFLGNAPAAAPKPQAAPVPRPPMICAGCPYRLFGEVVARMRRKGELEAVFGDIGCNTLLYFFGALDTGLAMGASESKRTGYVLSKPESVSKCISLLGDGTECHSGMDATRNAVFRNVSGVKVVLDNEWTAMTGGQPGPTSPINLAGDKNRFDLVGSLKAQGAEVELIDAYDLKSIRKGLRAALKAAEEGTFTTLVIRGTCIRKVPAGAYGQKVKVDAEKCVACGACNICPGIVPDANGIPQWNNLCTGCVSKKPSCLQMCPKGAISINTECTVEGCVEKPELPVAPESINVPVLTDEQRPARLSLSIRGVGGQGNLFFGKALAQMAFIAGYGEKNILKGETHGMAQMGGPVISTFACGDVYSTQFVPGSADALIVMEQSEILRPGFLDMLRPDGTILLSETAIVPQGFDPEKYPSQDAIAGLLSGYNVVRIDVLKIALALGDERGRCANVVMLGALSKLAPFDAFPVEVWLQALKNVSPKPAIWTLNHAAFLQGRTLV
ncbi:2-oxoacid:acceptor oxidoreductase family protein [Oleidesulfovibrio sp.]|uniref:2-oxoacid:acceptor oxidoreductase family protein n=1 Tax=Oleidesulfovibrio sp. TaxID=2909707 RepID=UPI003A83720D